MYVFIIEKIKVFKTDALVCKDDRAEKQEKSSYSKKRQAML